MLGCLATVILAGSSQLRPPSVPLITHDPYFSVWSPADRATDVDTTHWTGKPQPLSSLVRVDGKVYRLLGKGTVEPMAQQSLEVTATQTTYTFASGSVQVKLSFASPVLADDLDLFSRPATYVSFEAKSLDRKQHDIEWFFGLSGNLCANTPDQEVVTSRGETKSVAYFKVGTAEQPVLAKRGDDLRIDWGYAALATDRSQDWVLIANEAGVAQQQFATNSYPRSAVHVSRRPAGETMLTASRKMGAVRQAKSWLMVAYDDIQSLRYFDSVVQPYWRRHGASLDSMLDQAASEHDAVMAKCNRFDKALRRDLERVGGTKYAQVGELAYRQAVAGNKLVADANGRPLLFPKENFSNGCIGTVDVIYPMAPLFLLLGSDLSRAMLTPVLDYGASKRWRFPFAPHDLGTYPHATGQVYGGGEDTEDNQMPVEESGNMILLVSALAKAEGRPTLAKRYWPQLTRWAEYLREKGLDPANQLCTDDFMGHLAHNANLSVKAILALGAYGQLAHQLGEHKSGNEYLALAKEYATKWLVLAQDGDHTRLAFDRSGTWSQKYNMVWDRILGLNLFPQSLKESETAFYLRSMNRYGLPLDNRSAGMKIDWLCWTATLSGDRGQFEQLIAPMWDFINETPDRVPICDWVRTDNAKHIGMIARPVIGGVFLPLLNDPKMWQSWFARGVAHGGDWAPIPMADRVIVVPTAKTEPVDWRYCLTPPADGWINPRFDDSSWSTGKSGFGTNQTPGAVVGTEWKSDDIWMRRSVVIPKADPAKLRLTIHHDEGAEVYINGVLAVRLSGWTTGYAEEPLSPAAIKAIRWGQPNMVAVHCHQTSGGQFIDLGFSEVSFPAAKGKR